MASRGPDDGPNLVMGYVGIVLAEVSDPVPVGLVGQLGSQLGSLVEDTEQQDAVGIGQARLEVVRISLEKLLVYANRLTWSPHVGTRANGDVGEHGILTASLEPGLVEDEEGAVKEG